jgi:hypothetical protein
MAMLPKIRDALLALYFIFVPLASILWGFVLGGAVSGPVGVAVMLVALIGSLATGIAGLHSLGNPPSALNGLLLIVGGAMMGANDGTIAMLGGGISLVAAFVFGVIFFGNVAVLRGAGRLVAAWLAARSRRPNAAPG